MSSGMSSRSDRGDPSQAPATPVTTEAQQQKVGNGCADSWAAPATQAACIVFSDARVEKEIKDD
jgi:hypothetical protein